MRRGTYLRGCVSGVSVMLGRVSVMSVVSGGGVSGGESVLSGARPSVGVSAMS